MIMDKGDAEHGDSTAYGMGNKNNAGFFTRRRPTAQPKGQQQQEQQATVGFQPLMLGTTATPTMNGSDKLNSSNAAMRSEDKPKGHETTMGIVSRLRCSSIRSNLQRNHRWLFATVLVLIGSLSLNFVAYMILFDYKPSNNSGNSVRKWRYRGRVGLPLLPGGSIGRSRNGGTTAFTPIPPSQEKTACIVKHQKSVIRAFEEQGWKVHLFVDTEDRYITDCMEKYHPAVIWTKSRKSIVWNQGQAWQRYNWMPRQDIMSHKYKLQSAMRKYIRSHENNYNNNKNNNTVIPVGQAFPDVYLLPDDRLELLQRLDPKTGGLNEPWVIKLSSTDNGMGIAIVGPNSPELHLLQQIVHDGPKEGEPNRLSLDALFQVHERIIFDQKNDTRSGPSLERAIERTRKYRDPVLVQRYVCGELTYYGRKFDLRIFYMIASSNPLIVLYHDGLLRVAVSKYNERNFDTTQQHLTNLGRNLATDNCTASFAQWEPALRQHVQQNPHLFARDDRDAMIRKDPLEHVRRQIMSTLAEVVDATRHQAYQFPVSNKMENNFCLMGGDFIVDDHLDVWMTEAQSSPGLGHETSSVKRALNSRLLPSMVRIVETIMNRQTHNKAYKPASALLREDDVDGATLLGDFRLIYTDDFQYKYNYQRPPQRGPCG